MRPERITRAIRAAGVAAAWGRQYKARPGRGHSDKRELISELKTLSVRCDADAIDALIGNGSWTRVTCTNCDAEAQGKEAMAVLNGVAWDEYGPSTLCRTCLTNALDMLRSAA